MPSLAGPPIVAAVAIGPDLDLASAAEGPAPPRREEVEPIMPT
jgi:hypothetical protein